MREIFCANLKMEIFMFVGQKCISQFFLIYTKRPCTLIPSCANANWIQSKVFRRCLLQINVIIMENVSELMLAIRLLAI